MSQIPIIGITGCSRLDDYVTSIERAGGRVRVLEIAESPQKVICQLDGLLLTGGGDVDPVLYGEVRHQAVEDAEPGRDEFEIDLARRAIVDDLPVLAICRGAQVLNVAAGGSLVQDIPSSCPSQITHTVPEPKNALCHPIDVVPGSRLAAALGPALDGAHGCRVNSRHHQAVARLGRSLVVAATAPDGIIEAIEQPDLRFCVGVQWHPENFCAGGEFSSLFDAFLGEARARCLRERR